MQRVIIALRLMLRKPRGETRRETRHDREPALWLSSRGHISLPLTYLISHQLICASL